jgi:hypothetical protein
MPDSPPSFLQAQVPIMDRKQFSALSGLTIDTVEAMVARGYLPCIRIGKRSMINLALLSQRCLEKDFS